MAGAAVSMSRGLHLSVSDGKHRVRVWGGHVGLGFARSWSASRVRVNFRKGNVRRAVASKLEASLGDCPVSFTYGKMLSEVSSWGIGGPAKMFVEVTTPGEMASVLRFMVLPFPAPRFCSFLSSCTIFSHVLGMLAGTV
jgi:hypothetical protein